MFVPDHVNGVVGLVGKTMLPYQTYSYKCREQAKWRELVSIYLSTKSWESAGLRTIYEIGLPYHVSVGVTVLKCTQADILFSIAYIPRLNNNYINIVVFVFIIIVTAASNQNQYQNQIIGCVNLKLSHVRWPKRFTWENMNNMLQIYHTIIFNFMY